MRAERVSGSPEWPLTTSELAAKFLDCARRVLGDRGAEALHEKLAGLASAPNVTAAIEATVPRASAEGARAGAKVAVEQA